MAEGGLVYDRSGVIAALVGHQAVAMEVPYCCRYSAP